MTPKEFRLFVKAAKRFGVRRVRTDAFEIEFDSKTIKKTKKEKIPSDSEKKQQINPDPHPNSPPPEMLAQLQSSQKSKEKPPTEDEMLYWSTPHFDQLRKQREAV